MELSILLWTGAALLIVVGLAGLVLPAMPGAPVLYAGLVLAAWVEDFTYVGTGTLIALGIMAVLTYVFDFAATALGAKRFGASPRAVAGATLGALLGVFLGLPGILLGPFVGAVAGELSVRRDLTAAGRAGIGATFGLALAVAGKLALGVAMVGVFLVVRFF